MKTNTAANHQHATQRIPRANSTGNPDNQAFAKALSAARAEPPPATKTDFANMTRQGMFDWMNNQIRSGQMSLDDSTPFLGMTIKISTATGQPVNMATDPSRINFIEEARLGVEGALSRNDQDLAKRLQAAIEIMKGNQAE